MKITKIGKQKKKGRCNVFIDNEFAFGLYEDTILKFSLYSGKELDDDLIGKIKDEDEFNHAKRKSFHLLSYKQRSKKEITDRLKKEKISPENIQRAVEYLEEKNFINDAEYAKNFFENLSAKKPLGNIAVKRKLQQKGIQKDIIEEIVTGYYDAAKETVQAEILLKKYSKKLNGLDKFERKKKIFRYLYSRGFGFDVINKVWGEKGNSFML